MQPIPKPRRRWWSMPQKISFVMILVVVMWEIYLAATHFTFNSSLKETEYLKAEIIKLSKKYVKALAEESNENNKDSSSHQTAVLLTNMLNRIDQLENQLEGVLVNSTKAFATMVNEIKILNETIQKIEFNKSISTVSTCVIPHDPGYPNCANKVEWMKTHWKMDKYQNHGVNGTVCSMLQYLSHVEDYCPKSFEIEESPLPNRTPNEKKEKKCLDRTHDDAYPSCKDKIDWLKKFWQSDPKYRSHGVDGSVCSMVKFLSEIESWCPLMKGRTSIDHPCPIPKADKFPHCGDKVAWMRRFWKSDPCYQKFGVNGSVCSFIVYLGEVERWCPVLPGRKRMIMQSLSGPTSLPDLSQDSLADLLKILQVSKTKIKYQWMTQRITRLWPKWLSGKRNLEKRVNLGSYSKKKILIYIGLLADEKAYHFAEQATKGGPLGELVQWSDLIVSLYLLGHHIQLSMDKAGGGGVALSNILRKSITGSCPTQSKPEFDIIYTDYIGVSHMIRTFKNVNNIKCQLRLLDSFGTEAQFNHRTSPNVHKSRNMYGFHDLNLKQYNTMFPHSPDNTFLGFIVENQMSIRVKKKRIALVYGKHISMWKEAKKISFLDIVQRYFEVHATVGDIGNKQKMTYLLPRYVINHGVLTGDAYQKLLQQATLFVGLGFPYEGPAPLEAIANGCFFLNAKLVPPLGRSNDKFFKQKPTERMLTSQHPYAEMFIGKPYVYTVDLSNKKEVEEAMEDMELKAATESLELFRHEYTTRKVEPYLPFEFTYEGMLERLYAFTKHHNFCERGTSTWPPLSSRRIVLGNVNEGCDTVCGRNNTICEPAYFPSINAKEHLPACTSVNMKGSLVAPGVMNKGECMLQTDKLFYSCTARSESTRRVCPCRDFVRGQIAFCKKCLDD